MKRRQRGADSKVRELVTDLSTLDEGHAPALSWLTPRLRELLDAEPGASYGLSVDGAHARLDFIHLDRGAPQMADEFARYLSGAPVRFAYYDPVSPEPAQRNRAMRLAEVEQLERKPVPASFRQLLVRCDLSARVDQLRLLVCDGPTLLAWVGGFRDGAFTAAEAQLLQAIAPALRRRLILERQLADGAAASLGLAAALEAVAAPAFLLNPRGLLAHANAAGRAELDRDRSAVLAAVSARAPSEGGPYAVTRFVVPGQGEFRLAVRKAAPADLQPRVQAAAQRWKLTGRQAEVLGLLARGLSNRSIAANLHCAERTAELHVSAILFKAEAQNRAQLVARLWLDP